MKKIFVDKKETAPAAVEKIIAEPESEIVLIVPQNAALKDSVDNFHIIKREAEALGKTIFIESVDESVLALAKKAKIESAHPLFSLGEGGRSLLDIIPPRGESKTQSSQRVSVPEVFLLQKIKSTRKAKEKEPEQEIKISIGEPRMAAAEEKEEKQKRAEEDAFAVPAEPKPRTARRRRKRIFLVIFGALLILGGGAWGFGTVFGRANITIHFKKTPWEYEGTLTATKTAAKTDPVKNLFPAEVFRESRNITKLFPASGSSTVAQKATGKITIYNAYSAAPQTLVATTRFQTADLKIFRLNTAVVVPGAVLKNGVLVPSNILADVTADKAGPEYNLSSSADRATLPGFTGSPRYGGFYGVFASGTAGGFIGHKAVQTSADIASAKTKTQEVLKSALQSNLLRTTPSGITIIPGASDITITKMTVNPATDANGNFSIFGTAEFRAIGFRESDVNDFLINLVSRDFPDMTLTDLVVMYDTPKPDFNRGELAVHVQASGNTSRKFDADAFRSQIQGKNVGDARSRILGLPDLMDAKISLWPFWLTTVPADPKKVKVEAR